jgi:hypothetical protein
MAISTALRFRNRTPQDNAVILDQIAGAGGNVFVREITDPVDVLDYIITTIEKNRAGDVIGVTDSDKSLHKRVDISEDAIVVTDAIVLEKSARIIITENYIKAVDDGFITDKDIIRQRVLQNLDSCVVVDDFNVTVTEGSSITFNPRALTESIDVIDDVIAKVAGTVSRTLSDSIEIIDRVRLSDSLLLADNVIVADTFKKQIIRDTSSVVTNKTLVNNIDVTDDISVTRSGVTVRTLSDSISVTEFDEMEVYKVRIESLDVTDTDVQLRLVYRVTNESINVTEDIIVSRSAILNSEVVAESLLLIDRAVANRIDGRGKSAKILHGIENM